ncbi:hypothetical protein [Methanosarcina mazei]|uniref:hypothetical protein n=1 Tax=Methanosarcina mazei TaxID=2209 RepID=UPI000B1604F7|nr:hypothetical protein [Methanosarcina mazei]
MCKTLKTLQKDFRFRQLIEREVPDFWELIVPPPAKPAASNPDILNNKMRLYSPAPHYKTSHYRIIDSGSILD